MKKYSTEDRVSMVQNYYRAGESETNVQRKWSSERKNEQKPSRCMIRKLIDRFTRTGDVKDDPEVLKTRQRTVRTPEVIESARELWDKSPRTSIRNGGRILSISKSTVQRLIRSDLDRFPYKIQTFQRLSREHVERRFEFCSEICQEIDEKTFDYRKVVFTDEAHFWLDGYVNKQNYRIWGSEKPEIYETKPLHPKKLTVWAGISDQGTIGPFFIPERTTVDKFEYSSILCKAIPELQDKGWVDGWHFQQDGAPAHCATENLNFLKSIYQDRVISRKFPQKCGGGREWPANSPDLSPCDFFMWGYVKDRVYKDKPSSLDELERKVREAIESIPAGTCRNVCDGFLKRSRMVTLTEGGHIEHVLH